MVGKKKVWCCGAAIVLPLAILFIPVLFKSHQMDKYGSFGRVVGNNNNDGRTRIAEFDSAWDAENGTAAHRISLAQQLTNHYYDIVTDFYEYGWGQSFHFAPRFQGEDFDASLARHEFWIAHKIGLREGMKALDVGCGVGGPMRNIARFTGAHVTGLNNNKYQIARGEEAAQREGLANLVTMTHGDFMKMPFDNNTFDRVYAIEATCHAPDKTGVYSEIFRVLKPGGFFGVYDWVTTANYNPKDPEHRKIKLGIEHGDSLPDLPPANAVPEALKKAGFEVMEHYDVAERAFVEQGTFDVPWYHALDGHFTISGFKHTPIGRLCTACMVRLLEFVGLAPTGSYDTAMMLEDAAHNLVLGGRLRLFTPMYYGLGRKPETKANAVPLPTKRSA